MGKMSVDGHRLSWRSALDWCRPPSPALVSMAFSTLVSCYHWLRLLVGPLTYLYIGKEVKEPHKNSPIAMVSALTTNWIVGAVFMIAVCYRLGDPTVVAAAPGGTSIIAVLMQATHSKVATTIFITAMEFNLFVSLFNILYGLRNHS